MKYFALPLLFAVIFGLASCENIEDNSSVMQAQVDSLFFKSFGTSGARTQEGGVILQGLSDNEILTLSINGIQLGNYDLGPDKPSYGLFEDANGIVYSTLEEGSSGRIRLTDRCVSCGSYTGTFQFIAVRPGQDTLYVSKGVFYDISFDVAADEGNNGSGSFSAQVDEVPFSPVSIMALDSGNSILISGASASNSILLRVPIEVEVGNYSLPMTGFQASYIVEGVTEDAQAGNISIISHDQAAKTISGTFSFQTENFSVTAGQFNVTYE